MVNLPESKKPGRNSPYEYSVASWKQYCKRHDLKFLMLDQRIQDEQYMNANWHKIFVFKLLEANEIPYDKILIVDGDTIVHPDAPNIFDVCSDGFCAVHNDGSYDWLLRSMEIYSKFLFDGKTFDFTTYFNSGVIVVNKDHQEMFDAVLKFYEENHAKIREIQDTFHVGTDQPILNFFVHLYRGDLEILPYEWNMQDLTRREVLDLDLSFTRFGWVYHFNAIPADFKLYPGHTSTPVQQWMKYTYEKLYA